MLRGYRKDLLLLGGLFFVPQELFQLVHELLDVFELSVNGGKPDVGHAVELMELLHHLLADLGTSDLPLALLLKVELDPVDDLLEKVHADRSLFAGLFQSVEDLQTVKGFPSTILLDHGRKGFLGPLAGGKAFVTTQAFPAATDRFFILRQTRIDNLAVAMAAKRTLHRFSRERFFGGEPLRSNCTTSTPDWLSIVLAKASA